MTRYRIVERRCPDSTTFYVEYKGFWWTRVQEADYEFTQDRTWATLEAARAWIAAQQAAQAPCTTIIHQP